MALYKAVYFFGNVMRDFLDVDMAAFTFYLGMNTVIEDILINIKEPHFAFFINPAYTGVFVA